MMKIFVFIFSYFFTLVLTDRLVFGFLPTNYFSELSLFYGFLGNAVYSLIEIIRRVGSLAVDEKNIAYQFNRWTWLLLGIRPFVAGLMSFVLTPIVRVSVSSMPVLENIINTKEADIIIGLGIGLLFEYIVKKAYYDKVAKKILNIDE